MCRLQHISVAPSGERELKQRVAHDTTTLPSRSPSWERELKRYLTTKESYQAAVAPLRERELKLKKSAVTPVLMEKVNPVFCTSPIPSRDKSRHGDKKIITNPVTSIKNTLYLKKVNHKNPSCAFGGTVSIFTSCTGVAKGLLFHFFKYL